MCSSCTLPQHVSCFQYMHPISLSPGSEKKLQHTTGSFLVHSIYGVLTSAAQLRDVKRTNSCMSKEFFIMGPFMCLLYQNILSPVSASGKHSCLWLLPQNIHSPVCPSRTSFDIADFPRKLEVSTCFRRLYFISSFDSNLRENNNSTLWWTQQLCRLSGST